MTNTNNKPAETVRDGTMKATIWANAKEDQTFYSVQFSRGYKDDQGNWHDADSFSNGDLLKLSHLAARAYDRIADLKARDANQGAAS